MQRAAAAKPPSAPAAHPQRSSENTDLETPPSKRRRTDADTPSSTPTAPSDLQQIQAALNEEEAKRSRAIDRQAEEAGETRWVLSTVSGDAKGAEGDGEVNFRVVKTGYSEIDSEASKPTDSGRKSFGKFNRKVEVGHVSRSPLTDKNDVHAVIVIYFKLTTRSTQKRQYGKADVSSPSSHESSEASGKGETDEDNESGDGYVGTWDLLREAKEEAILRVKAKRKAQRRAEKAEMARLAEKLNSKEVKLNRLSSISGTGGGGRAVGARTERECFVCGEKGHEKRDCQQKGKRRYDDESVGRAKKARASLDY